MKPYYLQRPLNAPCGFVCWYPQNCMSNVADIFRGNMTGSTNWRIRQRWCQDFLTGTHQRHAIYTCSAATIRLQNLRNRFPDFFLAYGIGLDRFPSAWASLWKNPISDLTTIGNIKKLYLGILLGT